MKLGTLVQFGWMCAVAVLFTACAADKPDEGIDEEESFEPRPMQRTTPDAATGDDAGDAAAGDAAAGDAAAGAVSMERGKQVYQQYCVTCHMANGQGMAGVYPPLQGAEFLQDKNKTISAVANGLTGPITVKGKTYNNVMPPIPGSYSNADIASVLNYVSATFGDGSWTATEEEVAAIRKQ